MKNSIVTRRTLSVLVENAPGVLSQVSRLFSRKGYNIESLAVGTTDDPAVSRITLEGTSDEAMIEQIMNQLRKLFPVYSVQELLPERSIRRELVMFKVKAETHLAAGRIHSARGSRIRGPQGASTLGIKTEIILGKNVL